MSHPLPGKEMEFDLTRNDRFFSLKIPYYIIEDDLVLYEIHLKDLVNNRTYVHTFRFNNLKTINQKLLDKNCQTPEFPKTHFWRKTNKHPEMIEQRRTMLENYLSVVINDPFLRGYPQIKKFISSFKRKDNRQSRLSLVSRKEKTESPSTKSRSYSNTSKQLNTAPLAQLKSIKTPKNRKKTVSCVLAE